MTTNHQALPVRLASAKSGAGRAFSKLTGGTVSTVDVYATQAHFVDHLTPVWLVLKAAGLAGAFIIPETLTARALRRGVSGMAITGAQEARSTCVLTASIGDTRDVAGTGRRLALLEHGCGLSFGGAVPGHSGGHGTRDEIELFLMTNEWCARLDREAHPNARVVVTGSPKMDGWFARQWPKHDPPIVGYATHWDCATVPETRSSFPYYRDALRLLTTKHRVIAHTHPRSLPAVWGQFSALGLDTIRDWHDFLEAVDVLVCDVGSAPYEFAATGRPVVVCNCPLYRKTVDHGLRFWDKVPGLQVDDPRMLSETVDRALLDPPNSRMLRESAVASVYPNQGRATAAAVAALEVWVNGR